MAKLIWRAQVKFNLFALQKRLELLKGEPVTREQIAEGAGLHINTIYNLFGNKSKRVDLETIEKLVVYFNNEGLTIDAGDLFTTQREQEEAAA